MINGDVNNFLNVLYSGQDIIYKFDNKKYWFQGYSTDTGFHMEIFQYQPRDDNFLWESNKKTVKDCYDDFLSSKIFNGKTFWDVENEIEWLDE